MRKAEADYRFAIRRVPKDEPFNDQRCFHCQQSAEKYLKAMLEDLAEPVPRTHDLDRLLTLLRSQYPHLRPLRRGLVFLSRYAVDTRYPGEDASKRQMEAALRWAGRVRDACRAILGI